MQHRMDVLKLAGNTGMMLLGMVLFLFTVSGGTLWYLGGRIQANLEEIRIQEETLQKLNAKTWGVEFVQDGEGNFWLSSGEIGNGDSLIRGRTGYN